MAEGDLNVSTGEEKSSKFDTIVAIFIALVAVIAAVVAWRASVYDDAAGDYDYDGLRALTNEVETRTNNYVNAYAHFSAFLNYSRNYELYNLIDKEISTRKDISEDELANLQAQQAESLDLAKASQSLFPIRFINRKGDYAVEREMKEKWADEERKKDLYPDPKFEDADKTRIKVLRLLAVLGLLAVALVFYSTIESIESKLKYVIFGIGTVILIVSSFLAVYIDMAL